MKISTAILSLLVTTVTALAQDRSEAAAYPGEWRQWRGPDAFRNEAFIDDRLQGEVGHEDENDRVGPVGAARQ